MEGSDQGMFLGISLSFL